MTEQNIRDQLVTLSRELGAHHRDWAILAEGNASAFEGRGVFSVKASGTSLSTASDETLVRIDHAAALEMLETDHLTDSDVEAGLRAMTIGNHDLLPSTECVLHAACLAVEGVQFVGHTHPTAINALTCSRTYPRPLEGRIFPDEIVICGRASVFVEYVDPGLPLARTVRARIKAFRDENGETPKTIYLQNHGFIALGSSAKQVLDITAMAVKAAQIRLGAMTAGGIQRLPESEIARIHTRPDEAYRLEMLKHRLPDGDSESEGL